MDNFKEKEIRMASGVKNDKGKPPLGLIDRRVMEEVSWVLDFGARKYGRDNWRGGFIYSRLYDAALRHIFAFIDGENLDPESGLPHIAHSICMLMFLLSMICERPDLDDRYVHAQPVPGIMDTTTPTLKSRYEAMMALAEEQERLGMAQRKERK